MGAVAVAKHGSPKQQDEIPFWVTGSMAIPLQIAPDELSAAAVNARGPRY